MLSDTRANATDTGSSSTEAVAFAIAFPGIFRFPHLDHSNQWLKSEPFFASFSRSTTEAKPPSLIVTMEVSEELHVTAKDKSAEQQWPTRLNVFDPSNFPLHGLLLSTS